MQYREGRLGRVFVAKIENGDNLMQCIKELAIQEQIQTASVILLGALKGASMVTGPKEPVIPVEPVWKRFEDGREVVGIGTIFNDEEGPSLHLHGGVGKGDQAMVGCLRNEGETFLVVEVIVLEILGIDARRSMDKELGLKLLTFIE